LPEYVYTRRTSRGRERLQEGPVGFYILCRMCGGRFESRGLHVCPECYEVCKKQPDFDDDKRWSSVAGRVTFEHRICLWCGSPIETFRNGRKVQSTVKFCSNQHRQAHQRATPDGREARMQRIRDLR